MTDNNLPESKIDLYALSREKLSKLLDSWGYSTYHSRELWRHLYQDKIKTFEDMLRLRTDLVQDLQQAAVIQNIQPKVVQESSDGWTRKILYQLNDGQEIETVLMRFQGRATVCVSTQVGCAMGCVFCATGQMGFTRHLTTGEIVEQVIHASRHYDSQGQELSNVVFMGMGEPLHNYENTMEALEIICDDVGLAIAPRRITVSTIGLAPSVRRLADEQIPVNLAVSLHAANDFQRTQLAPVNKQWPLEELLEACRFYSDKTGRRIFFEWTLIGGNNDSTSHAHEVAQLLSGMNAHLNLIPYNPIDGYSGEPSDDDHLRRFQQILSDFGIPSTVRQKRGIDIEAGCGQLRTSVSRLHNL